MLPEEFDARFPAFGVVYPSDGLMTYRTLFQDTPDCGPLNMRLDARLLYKSLLSSKPRKVPPGKKVRAKYAKSTTSPLIERPIIAQVFGTISARLSAFLF